MRIFCLELKRVLQARLTWILLALALILSVLLAYLPATYCYSSYTDEAGNEVNLTGLASISYEKERQADASGIVTPERVREAVEIYQACLTSYGVTESYDLPEGVYEEEILPIAPLLHGVKEAFADHHGDRSGENGRLLFRLRSPDRLPDGDGTAGQSGGTASGRGDVPESGKTL